MITTPYSFVATSHSLLWNGIKPVFVDIDPQTLNLDPAKIEAAITPQTTAIMPVHCYGHAADIEAIQTIADNYNLKVIYDAAHAFGVQDAQGSILRHGDLSVLSFHATKVFNTFEGGAIVCPDIKTKTRIDQLKNFGHVGEVTVVAPGINGKMNEFNAALGVTAAQAHRRSAGQAPRHRRRVSRTALGRRARHPLPGQSPREVANYALLPDPGPGRLPGRSRRPVPEDEGHRHPPPARYFYPLISEFPMYRGLPSAHKDNLPVATAIARQVLCLPIYPDLPMSVVEEVAEFIASQ